jgi:Uma2 family endonuclease
MTARAPRHRYAYADYVTIESDSSVKHEYFDGEIYAMAGGTPDHARLAANFIAALRSRLPAGCFAFTSDLRIRIPATGLSTYPDVTIVCGKTQRAQDDRLAVTNPVLVAEVTSPSTEEYDRGEKVVHYKELPSLREIVLISHSRDHVELHRRQPDGSWTRTEVGLGESISLSAIGGDVEIAAIYEGGFEDAGASG